MTPEDYAADFTASLQAWGNTARTQQTREGLIGASDFVCRERMRRILVQSPETDRPEKWAAFVGTALDKEIKAARQAAHPDYLYDVEWTVNLAGYRFKVHPDEVNVADAVVIDYKTKAGLALVRAGVMDDPARMQRHLQYLAGIQAGVLPLDGIVGNVVVDRSGSDSRHHVEMEPYSQDVIDQAAQILTDVMYAVKEKETASKDWPRTLCTRFCPYATDCRGSDIDMGLIVDPDEQALVSVYATANAALKEAEQLKSELRPLLRDLNGKTDTHKIWWTVTNKRTGPVETLHVEEIGRAS